MNRVVTMFCRGVSKSECSVSVQDFSLTETASTDSQIVHVGHCKVATFGRHGRSFCPFTCQKKTIIESLYISLFTPKVQCKFTNLLWCRSTPCCRTFPVVGLYSNLHSWKCARCRCSTPRRRAHREYPEVSPTSSPGSRSARALAWESYPDDHLFEFTQYTRNKFKAGVVNEVKCLPRT